MQIKALLITPLVAAGVVSAAPKASATPKVTYFNGLALRSASPVHFNYLQASKESFELKLKKQGAECYDQKTHNEATFELYGDELWLYSQGNPRQQAYVDFSGMGQGKFGFTTGAQPAPKNASRKGWKLDKDGLLTCDGASFVACPNGDNLETTSWSVWVYNSIDNPGGNKNCLPFSVKAAEVKKPVACMYSAIQPSN
ncbi:cell wall protein [Fusarium heterosporum]|uniref:Cell wall protein n=1 Tax=Fusarium heterosporum TaxID=42747 RepID=A0A8H5TUP4_FUSHE|nr:cell wall protein [Fusarium heterosporum]